MKNWLENMRKGLRKEAEKITHHNSPYTPYALTEVTTAMMEHLGWEIARKIFQIPKWRQNKRLEITGWLNVPDCDKDFVFSWLAMTLIKRSAVRWPGLGKLEREGKKIYLVLNKSGLARIKRLLELEDRLSRQVTPNPAPGMTRPHKS